MCRRGSDFGSGRARGFSLVELMVAVVIGLLVLAAISTVMVSSKKNYTVQDSLARLQENARFAVDFITRDLRMSGYFGCAHEALKATQNQLDVADTSTFFNAAVGLAGVEDVVVDTSKWYPSEEITADPSGTIKFVPGSDVLLVRYMNGAGTPLTGSMTAPTNPLTIAAGNRLRKGDIAIVADCNTADMFQITSDDPDATGILGHATGVSGIAPGNKTNSLSKPYELDQSPVLASFTIARYFIATNTARPGRPGLYRQVGSGPAQELVEGIENMQILYGVNTDPPSPPNQPPAHAPNVYVSADKVTAVGGWGNITSVRIGLLAYTLASETESGEYGGVTDVGPYNVNGKTVSVANDNLDAKRVKRRVFTTTVALRNLR
jgi:type IV pilus assembly protein PilW